MQSNPMSLWATWPMPPFTLQAFGQIDDKMIENWQKFMGLNSDFAKSMVSEAQFDWASCFVPQDPEELYARQWTNQMPMLSIPLHYATAMMELGAATQRAWMDAWGRMLGWPMLLPDLAVMPNADAPGTDGPNGANGASGVEDVPAANIRETPRSRKSTSH